MKVEEQIEDQVEVEDVKEEDVEEVEHLSAEVPSLNLLPPIASISSMKMMHGCKYKVKEA